MAIAVKVLLVIAALFVCGSIAATMKATTNKKVTPTTTTVDYYGDPEYGDDDYNDDYDEDETEATVKSTSKKVTPATTKQATPRQATVELATTKLTTSARTTTTKSIPDYVAEVDEDNACDHEPWVPNGEVTLSDGKIAIFCKDGYFVQDPAADVICDRQQQKWANLPGCIKKSCGSPPSRPNLYVNFQSFFASYSVPGSIVRYRCGRGYFMYPYVGEIVCTEGGRWSMQAPMCVLGDDKLSSTTTTTTTSTTTTTTTEAPPIRLARMEGKCGEEPTMCNGAVFTRSYTRGLNWPKAGDVFIYVCDSGYSVDGLGSSMGRTQCDGSIWTPTPNCAKTRNLCDNCDFNPSEQSSTVPSSDETKKTTKRPVVTSKSTAKSTAKTTTTTRTTPTRKTAATTTTLSYEDDNYDYGDYEYEQTTSKKTTSKSTPKPTTSTTTTTTTTTKPKTTTTKSTAKTTTTTPKMTTTTKLTTTTTTKSSGRAISGGGSAKNEPNYGDDAYDYGTYDGYDDYDATTTTTKPRGQTTKAASKTTTPSDYEQETACEIPEIPFGAVEVNGNNLNLICNKGYKLADLDDTAVCDPVTRKWSELPSCLKRSVANG